MAHKDQKDDKKSKGKSKAGKAVSSAAPAAVSTPATKGSKLKPYPLPVIRKCNCVQPYQDKLYGVGMRVHNPAKKMTALRCTGCGHDLG